MDVTMNRNGSELTVALVGNLDTNSSPALGKQLETELDGVTRLVFDLKEWNIYPVRVFVSCL